MKPQFSLFQKIMTTIFIVLQTAVMISDGIRLATDDGSGSGTYYFAVNLVLCAGLLAVFLVLIFNPKLCVSTEETDTPEQLYALISASRTYMCFIAVDIALIFAFVMFLSQHVSHPALIIVIGGVTLFIVGAIKYIYDSQKLVAAEQVSDTEVSEEQTEEQSKLESENTEDTTLVKEEEQSAADAVDATDAADVEETAEAKDAEGTEEVAEVEKPEEAEAVEEYEEQPQEQSEQETEQAAEESEYTEDASEAKEEEQPPEEDEAAEVTEEQTAEDEATEEGAEEEEAPSEV